MCVNFFEIFIKVTFLSHHRYFWAARAYRLITALGGILFYLNMPQQVYEISPLLVESRDFNFKSKGPYTRGF